MLKSYEEALKCDGKVFKGDEKVLKDHRYTLKSNEEGFRVDDRALKGDGVR